MAKEKKKKKDNRIPKNVLKDIPYTSVSEDGVIEISEGEFAISYEIVSSDSVNASLDVLENVILCFGERDFQVSSYDGNERIITLRVNANTPDDAKADADRVAEKINSGAKSLGVSTKRLSLKEVLSFFCRIYANGKHSPDDKCALDRKALKKANLTTKDLVGPSSISYGKDYVETENGFSRTLFVNTFADHVEMNLVKNGSGVLSVTHFHPVKAKEALSEIREELASLQEKTSAVSEKNPVYPNKEEVRIKQRSTALLQDAEYVYKVSLLVTLFADDKESLDKKTAKYLADSESTFCRIMALDYNQQNALKSVLPLAKNSLQVNRLFSLSSAALFFPVTAFSEEVKPMALNETSSIQDFYVIRGKTVKSQKTDRSIKKSVQETIPYVNAHWENGIIEMTPGFFSKMYRFTDINYHTATEQDQIDYLEKYARLLNRIDSSMKCQIVLMNKNVNMDQFREENTLRMRGDSMDVFRREYNNMIVAKMAEGRNNLSKERYFVVSTEAENIEAAKTAFSRIDPEMITAFKEIGGSKAESLSTPERLELMFDIYNSGHEGTFMPEKIINGQKVKAMDMETLCSLGVTSKDLIAPSGFNFMRNWFRMGDKYCRVMYLTDLPNSLSDKFLSDLTSANCNMIVSMNLECMRQDKAVSLTRRQLTNINVEVQKAQQTASKNGYSMELVPAEIKQAQEEANELLSGLTGSNQKMFLMTFTVLIYGNSLEELNTNTDIIVTAGHKYLCNLKHLDYQQEDGLATTLPLAFNRLSIKRTLTTNSTVVFTPFDVQELSQPHGLYYGQNASSHNLIIYDRKQAQNGNGWILGTPGSGKSFAAKREIATVMMNTDDDILIIDPEREYAPMAQAFEGSIVRIAPGSKWHLNPLDLDPEYADDDDPIVLKSDFMISICETAVGGRYGLDPIQNSIIDRCVNIVYRDFIGTYNMDPEHTPTLLDFQNVLESQPEMPAKELAIALEIYTKGALDVFAHKSNVNINNRMVIYDIRDIGSSALRTLAYLVVLDNVWDRVVKNRRKGKRTWVYMDEVYILFEKEQSTNFIRQLFSRGRKYGCIMTALTQNVEPILANDVATTMLSNSAFIELLNQAPVDRELLSSLLNISPQQANYINSASPGHGLLYVQNAGIIPFADDFPRQICPELYKVMTSKPDEIDVSLL